MEGLAHGSAHAKPSTQPQSKIKFQNPREIFNPLSTQKSCNAGVPNFFIGILLFLLVGRPCKISKAYDNPFWEKSKGRKEKNAINSRHLHRLHSDARHVKF